ncbi:MAG: hypothetical protein R8M71_03085 [Alphaproteobacteria bacterium]|nr:hypothetical protein [Alphaproteobacteria bacterium]
MKKLFAFLSFLFITQIATADDIVCNTNIDEYWAIYEPYTYDCPSGYYLPANTLGCQPCPSGFTCPGGTFQFNPNLFQGLEFRSNITTTMNNVCAANFPSYISAIYTPNVHDCATGFYMPANMDGCIQCPENNYCAGGTYTFNETVTQGITQCPDSDPYAPVGMWDENQCGRKLHVGDDFLYVHQSPANPTTHRLYVKFGENVYSANATPVSESADLKISAKSQRSLHVKIDGVEYLIHDDSVK